MIKSSYFLGRLLISKLSHKRQLIDQQHGTLLQWKFGTLLQWKFATCIIILIMKGFNNPIKAMMGCVQTKYLFRNIFKIRHIVIKK